MKDYFAGAKLVRMTGNDIAEMSIISSYDPNTNICTLDTAFSDLDIATDYYVIAYDYNPINPTRKKDDPVNAINVLYDNF